MPTGIQSGALLRSWVYGPEGTHAAPTWGTAAGVATGIAFRRNTISLNQTPESFASNEIRSSLQQADFRHGVQRVTGQIQRDWAAGEGQHLDASLICNNWAAGVASSSGTVAVAAGSGSTQVITNAAADFRTLGFRQGDVIRLSGGTGTGGTDGGPANGINCPVVAVGTTTITIAFPNPATGLSFLPTVSTLNTTMIVTNTGATNFSNPAAVKPLSVTIEDYWGGGGGTSNLDISARYLGCYIGDTTLNIPGSGMITASQNIVGKRRVSTSDTAAPYFTPVAAATDNEALASTLGYIRFGTYTNLHLLSATFNINRPWTGSATAFETSVAQLFPGMLDVTGTFNFYGDSNITQLRTDLDSELEIDVHIFSEAPGTTNRRFKSIYLPRVKINTAEVNDVVDGLQVTAGFKALENRTGVPGTTGIELGTIRLQDSQFGATT